MNLTADPVLTLLPSAFFTLLLGIAATHKLTAWRVFEQQVADYRVLPKAWIVVAAVLLPATEALLALGWLADGTRPVAAALTASLLSTYAGAMAWNLRRGRDFIDCGCGGVDGAQVIRPALVARNLLLAAVAAAMALWSALLPAGARVPGWIDWLSVFAGAVALLGLYVTANQILANLPPQRVLD